MPSGSPSPSSKRCMLCQGRFLESAISAIPEQRVPHSVPPIGLFHGIAACWGKVLITAYALSRRRPHIRDVELGFAIAVVIEPGGTHSWTDIFYTRTPRHVPETAFVVNVKVLPSEIICNVEVGPAIPIEIAPGRCQAESVIVLIHPGFRRAVLQETATILI